MLVALVRGDNMAMMSLFKQEVHAVFHDGNFYFSGIDYEAMPKVLQRWWGDTILLIKIRGRRCWVGLGTWKYTSPKLIVVEITQKPDTAGACLVNYLFEKDSTRQTWRVVWDEAQTVIKNRIAELGEKGLLNNPLKRGGEKIKI